MKPMSIHVNNEDILEEAIEFCKENGFDFYQNPIVREHIYVDLLPVHLRELTQKYGEKITIEDEAELEMM